MPDDPASQKRAMRGRVRTARRERTAAERAAATAGLTARLAELTSASGARAVSCYLAAADEPDTRPFVDRARAAGVRVIAPVCRADGLLDWAVATGEERIGLAGTPEPAGDVLGPGALDEVDLILVPAAAVDATGMRLGWGRGYYDRTLAALRRRGGVYAVVFDSELVDRVPAEQHDRPVDGVVTPTRTVEFPTRRI